MQSCWNILFIIIYLIRVKKPTLYAYQEITCLKNSPQTVFFSTQCNIITHNNRYYTSALCLIWIAVIIICHIYVPCHGPKLLWVRDHSSLPVLRCGICFQLHYIWRTCTTCEYDMVMFVVTCDCNAVTFESLDIDGSLVACRYASWMVKSSWYITVMGESSMMRFHSLHPPDNGQSHSNCSDGKSISIIQGMILPHMQRWGETGTGGGLAHVVCPSNLQRWS